MAGCVSRAEVEQTFTSKAQRMDAMSDVSGSPANSFSASAALGPRTCSAARPRS